MWVVIQYPNLDFKFIYGFLTLHWHLMSLGIGWGQNIGLRNYAIFWLCCLWGHPCFTNTSWFWKIMFAHVSGHGWVVLWGRTPAEVGPAGGGEQRFLLPNAGAATGAPHHRRNGRRLMWVDVRGDQELRQAAQGFGQNSLQSTGMYVN